jgi:hypothetical protein
MPKCESQKYTPMGIRKSTPYFPEIASDLKNEFCIYIGVYDTIGICDFNPYWYSLRL